MELKSVFDESFAPYGRVVYGLDTAALRTALRETTGKPMDAVVYVPSCEALEALPIFDTLRDSVYGGMPIQIGYCNGSNTRLNCVEYHRDSEINIVDDDMVFLVARQQDVRDGRLDTAKVEAFRAPAGTAVRSAMRESSSTTPSRPGRADQGSMHRKGASVLGLCQKPT